MKLDLTFEKILPQDIETVWRALTDPEAIGAWLMRTDFAPEPGRRFRLWFDRANPEAGHFDCELLELQPPRRMVWSWQEAGAESPGPMRVSFTLEPLPEGTRLSIHHEGERDPDLIERFKSGWPEKLETLEQTLAEG